MKKSGLKPGDSVEMVKCYEAAQFPDKVWNVRSDPWEVCGSEVVLLEGKHGGFDTSCLKKVQNA